MLTPIVRSCAIDDAINEKLAALQSFTEKILKGRWNDARQPNEKELKATSILKLPLTEVSAKVRIGDVEDDAEDYKIVLKRVPYTQTSDPSKRASEPDDPLGSKP